MCMNSKRSAEDIKQFLEIGKSGNPIPTIDNAAIILREDPLFAGKLRNDLFRKRIELTGNMPWPREKTDVDDMDEVYIRHYIEKTYKLMNEKKIRDGLQLVAHENSFHPVRDYLNALEWDGVERIRNVLHHFLGAGTDDFTCECMRLFLLGAISRVFRPGCKFDYMLCLVGGQGVGKSTFFRFLATKDEWFCDDIKRMDDEKVYEHLVGHWVIEMAEMLALNNVKCNEATKNFLSKQYDNYRLPYGYRADDRARQCVIAGTSNIINFLPNDRSGNRRFLPIMCDASKAEVHILDNEEESRKYLEQVWAEAMVIFRSGSYKLRLPKEIEKNLVKYQEPFMQEDTWADMIKAFLEDYTGDIVCIRMLYREALGMYGMPNRGENSQIMEIMSNIPGWVRFHNPRYFKNYKRQKGWERLTTNSDNQPSENGSKQMSIDDNPFETPCIKDSGDAGDDGS